MIEIQDIGLVKYADGLVAQQNAHQKVLKEDLTGVLILCEHHSVITMGRNSQDENLLLSEQQLVEKNVELFKVNRGGDVTLHNPQQLVAYPIFNLTKMKQDLHWFLRAIEEAIIITIDKFGLKGDRVDGLTGVWLEHQRKIAAIGLHCSRWVTSHGLALNVNNDLSEFDYIIPCGISDKQVTSIVAEIGTSIDMNLVKSRLTESFFEVFQEYLKKDLQN